MVAISGEPRKSYGTSSSITSVLSAKLYFLFETNLAAVEKNRVTTGMLHPNPSPNLTYLQLDRSCKSYFEMQERADYTVVQALL